MLVIGYFRNHPIKPVGEVLVDNIRDLLGQFGKFNRGPVSMGGFDHKK
jgi:hypothetical protein